MPTPEQIYHFIESLYHSLHMVVATLLLIVGIWVAVRHLKELVIDYSERLRDKEHRYRVRTTIVKDMMDDQATQTAKLRRLRVSKNTNKLILDPWPTIVPLNANLERPAALSQFYSLPGRLGTQVIPGRFQPETKFLLNLSPDEELKAHREYSTLLIYTLDERLHDILTPPGFIAAQPVGEECFTYEAHFPPNRTFVRTASADGRKDKPKIRVFRGPPEENHELRYESYSRKGKSFIAWKVNRLINRFRTRYHVEGGRTNFGDSLGEHDWFRVTVLKPPRERDIHICWCMTSDPITWSWCSHEANEHK